MVMEVLILSCKEPSLVLVELLDHLNLETYWSSPLSFDYGSGRAIIHSMRAEKGTVRIGRGASRTPECDLCFVRGSGILSDEPWSRMIPRIRKQYEQMEQWIRDGAIGCCLNAPAAQLLALDKYALYDSFGEEQIPLPRRFPVRGVEEGMSIVREQGQVVKKPRYGLRGYGVSRLDAVEEESTLRGRITDRFGDPFDLFLFQEYVRDVETNGARRLYVMGGKVVFASRFVNEGSFLTNVSCGGSSFPYQWNPDEDKWALRCARAFGLEFCSVDFVGDFVLEVNGSGTGLATLHQRGALGTLGLFLQEKLRK